MGERRGESTCQFSYRLTNIILRRRYNAPSTFSAVPIMEMVTTLLWTPNLI